jgi:hypothetical protein
VVGACAAEPIDAAQAATLAASLPPAAGAVCCPAAEGGGLLLFEPGSPEGVGVEPTGSTRSLLGALGLQPVRARLAVSTGSGRDGSESELLGRLRQCCLRAGSALVPPGVGASTAVAVMLPAANAGGGRSSGGKGRKGKQAGGETAAAAAAEEEGANAAMGGFAEVAVLLSQTPAPGYGSPAVQVRGHIGAPTLHSLTHNHSRMRIPLLTRYASPAAATTAPPSSAAMRACRSSAVLPLCVHTSLCSQCRWNGGRLEPPQRWRRQLSHYLWTCCAFAPRLRPPRQHNYAK